MRTLVYGREASELERNLAKLPSHPNLYKIPQLTLLLSNRLDSNIVAVTETGSSGTAKATGQRIRPRGNASSMVPRELIAHSVGKHLALDFCNTAGEHLAERPNELLLDWESFLRWAVQVGLVGPESYFELLRHPEPLGNIIQLREAIYRVGLGLAGVRLIFPRDVALIRERAHAPLPDIEFLNNRGRWHPAPKRASSQFCAVLANEALSLLCSPKAARIGVCGGGNCGWLFLDESRGKRRRWCDMNDCGSRAKARRYYQKHKGS